jgi:hypothetical protein
MHPTFEKLAKCLLAAAIVYGPTVRAQELGDVDTRFRAKIMKERAKAASATASSQRDQNNQSNDPNNQEECGSQNIGNINSGGRPGSQPREVFIFAPNAINVVGPRGCR